LTTARWWSDNGAVPAVGRGSAMDKGNSKGDGQQRWRRRWTMERMLDDSGGQQALKAVTARQQCSMAVGVVAVVVATVTSTVQWRQR
jgi:hypothetical protein